MEITLGFSDSHLIATAIITVVKEINTNEFSFILNDELIISGIICNGIAANYQTTPTQPEYRALSKKILIKSDDYIRSIIIMYSGTLYSGTLEKNRICWCNIITPEMRSLSYYSAWCPQETSIPIVNDKVVMLNGEEYFVVKGSYNSSHKAWEYGGKGYDPFNIVAYRKDKMQVISNDFINIYFIDDKIKTQAEKAVAIYGEIIDFYNGNLFKRIEIPVLDFVCASPVISTGGGYFRKDFIWTPSLGDNDRETMYLFAHENAHRWCAGADVHSWEDWLNETTAEWATLLFFLNKNDNTSFDHIINSKLERHKRGLPAIKTADGSRPRGVHDTGTVLFYEMYKLYGVEAVKKAVRLFADLEHKNTDSFIQELYNANEDKIADFIKEALDFFPT
jgi:hypothetical protein